MAKSGNCRPSGFLAVVLRFAFVVETVCVTTSAHMSVEQLQAAPALDKRSFRSSGVRLGAVFPDRRASRQAHSCLVLFRSERSEVAHFAALAPSCFSWPRGAASLWLVRVVG